MSSQIYKNTDTDAPVLVASIGGLIGVLDDVLINGYGDKEPLGWIKEFQNTNNSKAVYRNKGTGYFMCVNQATFPHGTYSSATVTIYESMRDLDTGYIPMPDNGNTQYICCANSQTGGVFNWTIIGDDKGFWFLSYPIGDNDAQPHYFGDYVPFYATDFSNWASVAANNTTLGLTNEILLFGNTRPHIKVKRNHQNQQPWISADLYSGTNKHTKLGQTNQLLNSSVPVFIEPLLGETGNRIIGKLPGLYTPLHNSVAINETFPITATSSIHTFKGYNDYYFGLLVGEGFRE